MQTYRVRLRPLSATLSPWQADTLFGHWCWLIRYEEGEAELGTFLEPYLAGEPPIVLSNGFPEEWLPRPILPPRLRAASRKKTDQVEAMQAAKAGKDVRFVSLDDFNDLCRGDEVLLTTSPDVVLQRTELKNLINRLTGTTASFEIEGQEVGGTLFDRQELAYVYRTDLLREPLDVSIYVKAADEGWATKAEDLFRRLARSGYGAKKTVGYGQFEVVGEIERFDGFAELDDANGFVSLSNWVPARGDPQVGFYDTLVKYGKLGEELAVSENPFKFPLTMLTAGSSFYAEGEVRDYYGRLVEGIAPVSDEVVQYGYAFAVLARLAVED
jgi:CRISPR-associated protein Csm4